jgi:hypothetical protein
VVVAVALVALAAGLYLVVDGAGSLSSLHIGESRTALGERRVVALEARKYVVWFQATSVGAAGEELKVPAGLEVEVVRRSGGRPLRLDPYGGSFTTNSGRRHSRAVWTVRVPRAGPHVIAAQGGPPGRGFAEPSVVLGQPIGRVVARIVAGAGLAMTAALALVLALVLGRRREPGAADPFGR